VTIKGMRGLPLQQEAEALFRSVRVPGTGKIRDAAEVHASSDGQHVVFTGTVVQTPEALQTRICRTVLATGESEILWVRADPNPDSLPVKRAQGTTTALAFAAEDTVKVIGIAMPQLADYPMAPVSRGRTFHNFFQEFPKHIVVSNQARKARNAEFPNGDSLDRDILPLGMATVIFAAPLITDAMRCSVGGG